MRWLLVVLGMSLLGAAGWWLGEPLGIFGSFTLSMIASGVGLWGSRKIVDELLPE